MEKEHCVIVGGSHSAAQLAASLRQEGWGGDITIASAEPCLPYHRPPLSKAYLSGEKNQDELFIRPSSFYEDANIDLLLGSRVESIDRGRRRVLLHDGAEIPYTRLALATGARVRRIAIPGHSLDGVFYLRDLKDVSRIRRYVGKDKSAVIIGGGYIGLETAASLRKMGMSVTVLEAMPRVLQRVTAPEVSAFFSRVHREEGVRILTQVTVESLQGARTVEHVLLTNGEKIHADLVIVGIGVIPETGLAEQAGLAVDDGILVDEYSRTSDHDIVAVGDCTSHYNPLYARQVRLESVQNAMDQAKIAAKTLCGKVEAYSSLPWFWSDQYDVKLQIAGLSQGYDQVVFRGSWDTGRSVAVFYYLAGKLLAVDAMNRPKEFMLTRRALTHQLSPDPALLADESVPLQEIFES
ncbi:MAG TPA: FAD-dependent oxidoreductase [Pseudomonas sp.]|nr:FAD-dependent oxidoreductase [Pseudomonas sp.]